MTMAKRAPRQVEFGDFQTPDALAAQVVNVLKARGAKPASVVEPTCGHGSFVLAAMRGFESVRRIIALDLNPRYVAHVEAHLHSEPRRPLLELLRADFFSFDWPCVIRSLPEPVLFLGNPPWVTSSGLGAIGGANLPVKSNFQGYQGLDAITGKGNFDIAEWMLIRLLKAGSGRRASLAMLVKTSTARRVLHYAWLSGLPVEHSAIYTIDAEEHFGVSASACLLVCDLGQSSGAAECEIFKLESPLERIGAMGLRDGALVADAGAYDRLRHLIARRGSVQEYRWRSGVKHDCCAVMELRQVAPDVFQNGLGEEVRLEPEFVFPMMKGSEVAGARRGKCGARWMIVPQRSTSDDTSRMRDLAPQTWEYLVRHGEALDRRRSSIYRKRPRFAVFGVGPYTFAPWKVAVCGLYKRLEFALVGSKGGRPVIFDDTVNHLSFDSEADATVVADLMNSDMGREFLSAFIFWDAKRPITVDILRRLDVFALAREYGREDSISSPSRAVASTGSLF